MGQETQLQSVMTLLNDVVAPGVTEILRRLHNIPPPGDNPALQDEIEGIQGVAQHMADSINAELSPPAPETPTT